MNWRRASPDVDRTTNQMADWRRRAAAKAERIRGGNMKNKFFLAISALMVTAAVILSATAQNFDNKISFGTQIKLQCKVGTPVESYFATNRSLPLVVKPGPRPKKSARVPVTSPAT